MILSQKAFINIIKEHGGKGQKSGTLKVDGFTCFKHEYIIDKYPNCKCYVANKRRNSFDELLSKLNNN
mgnify:FL=1|tara:strand:- start:215 stop:418 length:204 start_codon:yes stop_codon:yes gene_type:complete